MVFPKLRLLVLLSGLFCVGSISRCAWDSFGPPAHRARVFCRQARIDLGQRRVGEEAVCEFLVSNTGGQDLEIHNVTAGCSCLASLFTQATVPPGYAVRLPVYVSLNRPYATFEKQLSIASNDLAAPTFALTIVARVMPSEESDD